MAEQFAPALRFRYLPAYADFLLKNHLPDLVPENIRLTREADIPLTPFYPHPEEAEPLERTSNDLVAYLRGMTENRALQDALECLNRWKGGQLPGIPREAIHFKDIIRVYRIRKRLLLSGLRAYTSDVALATAVMSELEELHVAVEQIAFGIFSDLQQEQRRKERDFSHSLISHTIDGIVAFDQELRITEWNVRMERLHGIARQDTLGKKFFDVFPHLVQTEMEALLLKVLRGEEGFAAEQPFTQKEGFYETRIHPLYGQSGEITGGLSICYDVTQRRENENKLRKNREELETTLQQLRDQLKEKAGMEEELREKEQKFRLLAENSSDMISVHTPEGFYRYLSPASESMTGYRAEELVGKMPFDFFYPPDIPVIRQRYEKLLLTGGSEIITYRFRHKNGAYIWLESHLRMVIDPQTHAITELQMSSRDVTLRKETEEALLNSETHLKQAQTMAMLGSWELDATTGQLGWSEELYRIYGLPPGKKLSLEHLRPRTHPEDLAAQQEWLRNTLEKGDQGYHEHRIIRADGQIRHIRLKGQAQVGTDGQVFRLRGIAQDITEIREAERQIRQQQHFIEQIANATPDILGVFTLPDVQPVYTNQEITRHLGYEQAYVLGLTPEERQALVHPEDQEKRIHYFQAFATAREDEIREMEYRIKAKDGAWRFFCVRGKIFSRNEDGSPSRIITLAQDITERKKADQALQDSRHFIQRITDTTPNLIYIYDLKQNQNVYVNRQLYSQLGYTWEQVQAMGSHFLTQTVHPEDFPAVLGSLRELASAQDTDIVEVEYRIRAANGEWHWFYDRATVFSRDPDGSVKETLGSSQDITERKGIEIELSEKNQALSQALDVLNQTRNELVLLNNELEAKVTERTRELAASEEELRQTLDQAVELNSKLSERENFLSSIIDQSPFSTWIADAQGTMVRQNKACLKLFGVTDPALANGRYNILKDEIIRHQPYYADIAAVFEQGKIARFEVLDYNVEHLKHVSIPSGRQVSLVTTLFPIKDEEGRVLSAVIQHEDITERRKAEEALIYQHKVTQTITRNTTSSLFMMNKDGHCTYLNPAAEKMFGFTQEEIGQQPLHYLIHHHRPDGSLYPKEECPIDRALPQNSDIRAHEDVFFRKDGSSLAVSCAASPIFENGVPVATVVEVRDITEEKEAQERLLRINEDLNRKNEELKRINIDLDNFVYTASHDLKAPIANLEGIISMMVRKLADKLDPQEMKLIDMMNAMTVRLKSTIKDLTEITKVQKELDQEKEAVSFEDILEDVKTDLQPLVLESKARLTTDFEVPELSYARKNLRSVLYNLVVNALKYRSPQRQPLIFVQTRRQEEFIVLSVQDNGLGIPAHQLHKLFAMFRRLHTHVEGIGIGLYITKRIIENNGGRIEVESTEGQGTTFRVYFRMDGVSD